jgi:hypothetical protein
VRSSADSERGSAQDLLRDRDVADVAYKRCGGDHLELIRSETEAPRDRTGEQSGLAGLAAQHRVPSIEDVDQHAHGCAMGVLETALKALAVQGRAGVVSQSQQQVVVEVLEPAATIRAHDHTVEAPAQVERDRDQVLDLRVVSVVPACRRVLAHDLVALEHFTSEPLHDRAARWIVIEAVRAHQIEPTVGVLVAPRKQKTLLRFDQLDRGAQDQIAGVDAFAELIARRMLTLELRSSLFQVRSARRPRCRRSITSRRRTSSASRRRSASFRRSRSRRMSCRRSSACASSLRARRTSTALPTAIDTPAIARANVTGPCTFSTCAGLTHHPGL